MKILALDPATKTGWAHSSGCSGVWDLSVRRDESGGMKFIRLEGKLNVMHESVGIDLLVYEAARHAAPKMQGALVVQAELQAIIKRWCTERKVQYRGYSPSELKTFATGKGNCGKPEMVKASCRIAGRVITDKDEADAICLLALAMQEYGKCEKASQK